VTSNAVCPGFAPAAIAERRKSWIERFFPKQILDRMPFARSLDQATSSYLVAATDPRYASVGGRCIVDGKERRSSDEFYAGGKSAAFVGKSLKWRGLDEE
jgi:hypothetical protein